MADGGRPQEPGGRHQNAAGDFAWPTHSDLTAWAGAEGVFRADPAVVALWQIPEEDKAVLTVTGIPAAEQLTDYVAIQSAAEPQLNAGDGRMLYRLARNFKETDFPGWEFGIEPGTGHVICAHASAKPRFANSSARHWIMALHLYGRCVATSPLLRNADDFDEDEVLAELRNLADQIKAVDPPAFAGYEEVIWAPTLDRWLW